MQSVDGLDATDGSCLAASSLQEASPEPDTGSFLAASNKGVELPYDGDSDDELAIAPFDKTRKITRRHKDSLAETQRMQKEEGLVFQ